MNQRDMLIDLLEHAYRKQSWHGPTLRGSIRAVAAPEAADRPAPGRHNIHEIVVHAAYWKYAVTRRLAHTPRGLFPLRGSNWWPCETIDPAGWKRSVRLLDDAHEALMAAVGRFPAGKLDRTPRGGKVTYWRLLTGVAAHDLYHAGQIQLIKKLRRR